MSEERSRVFFALWPDETAREGLDQVTRQVHAVGGGRRMRRETLHMTLAFIGEVPAERLEILRQAAGQVLAAAFMLRLDRLGCWRHNRIAWAGCSAPPLPLLTLVGKLRQRLAGAEFPLATKDFTSHVTLLRNVDCSRCAALPEVAAIDWPVNEFVLAESRLTPAGSHYRFVGRWPLAEGTAG